MSDRSTLPSPAKKSKYRAEPDARPSTSHGAEPLAHPPSSQSGPSENPPPTSASSSTPTTLLQLASSVLYKIEPIFGHIPIPLKLLKPLMPVRQLDMEHVHRIGMWLNSTGNMAIVDQLIVCLPDDVPGLNIEQLEDLMIEKDWDAIEKLGVRFKVVDGNHRVTAMKEVNSKIEPVCRVYRALTTKEMLAFDATAEVSSSNALPLGLIDRLVSLLNLLPPGTAMLPADKRAYEGFHYSSKSIMAGLSHFGFPRLLEVQKLFRFLDQNSRFNAQKNPQPKARGRTPEVYGLYSYERFRQFCMEFGNRPTQRQPEHTKTTEHQEDVDRLLPVFTGLASKHVTFDHEIFSNIIKKDGMARRIFLWLKDEAKVTTKGYPNWKYLDDVIAELRDGDTPKTPRKKTPVLQMPDRRDPKAVKNFIDALTESQKQGFASVMVKFPKVANPEESKDEGYEEDVAEGSGEGQDETVGHQEQQEDRSDGADD
uniref:DUF262 domain-containing protein n=1 Tax=Steinernema glaseri TaxID=37863 RepID=A0A1I7XYT2_9BILA